MMKMKLLFSALLLFVGVSTQAQSVAEAQMDERFNDGTNLPYGWFTEGWTVKDGVIQTKASSGFSFDLESLFGNKQDPEETGTEDPEETGTEDPEGDPEEDPDEKGEGTGGFNISDLLSSLMGGDTKDNYLLTPPLVVSDGETLVFSAKKAGKSGSGSGMSISFGSSGQLNVYYSLDNGGNWTYYDTFVQSGFAYFVAPSTGIYQLRFTSPGASLDNFYGFHKANDEIVNLEKVELNDGEAFCNDVETICEEISYTRNFTNTKWQALYLPFEMSYEDWSADFEVARLNDVHQWDDDEDGLIDRTELEVVKMKSGTTEANTPYLIRAKATGEKTITVANATLYRADEYSIDCSSIGTLFTFTGTYAGIDGATMFTEGYYAMGDGALVQAESSENSLSPYRWYLSVTDRYGNRKNLRKVKVVVFGSDEDTTGIDEINGQWSMDNGQSVFDLSGRRIESPRRGVYIMNGKKYLVK